MAVATALALTGAALGAASAAKNLFGKKDAPVSGMPDPSTGFYQPTNLNQTQDAYRRTTQSLEEQKKFNEALAAQGGVQNQSQIYNQLQNIAAGTGPNPAQAQLANATGANVANQAALMASQRGTSANSGLLARQAAQQGAATQQQAAGQAAALQAQQSQNAIGQAGNLASQQVGQQLQAQQNTNAGTLGFQSNLLNAAGQYNATVAGGQQNANTNNTNRGINQDNINATQTGNLLNAAGSVLGKLGTGGSGGGGGGGVVEGAGGIGQTMSAFAEGGVSGPKSRAGRYIQDMTSSVGYSLQQGGQVPGKPMVPGRKDTQTNDTVAAALSPGEVVLPRSVTQSDDPAAEAAKFVAAILAKSKTRRK